MHLHIDSPQAHPLTIDTGEVGLTANPRRKTAVQRVIPDVQLPNERGIHGRDEIARVVCHIDDVLIGANSVECRHVVRG